MHLGRWGTLPLRLRRLPSSKKIVVWGLVVFCGTQGGFVLEALVRARFADVRSDVSTRIYARPLVLASGGQADRNRVERHLERLGYEQVRGRGDVGPGEYQLSSNRWRIGRRAFRHFDRLEPAEVATIRLGYNDNVWSVADGDGRRMNQFVLEPQLIRSTSAPSRRSRLPVPLSAVPQDLIDAVLTIEDQHFFDHRGVDLKRIAGAAVANVKAGRVVQGGSTLTQQLAKNLFLTPRRTPIRKFRELLMALVLESRYSKEQILEKYLNEIYLGQDDGRPVHGVGMAAQLYFAKDISELETAESAFVAGLIRGPNLYAPHRNPEAARERRDLVLNRMRDREILTTQQHERATRSALKIHQPRPRTNAGRYFIDYVAQNLRRELGDNAMERGLSVYTTLDMELQEAAERAVRNGLANLERTYSAMLSESSPLQAAVVAVDAESGDVLAMVGGRDYGASQFNRAVYARRQPGSAFKPIVALAALSQREGYTLASVLEDEPLSVETPAGLWEPANYDGQFRGPVTLRDALERSLNVPFARLGLDVGAERIVDTARDLGLDGTINAVPSIALGASEVTPLGMTRAFGVLAASGFRADLKSTLAVVSSRGELLHRSEMSGEQVYQADETYLVTSALRGAIERGTGRGLRRAGFRGAVAGKSGTTNDYRDAWFVGFTPKIAVAVWVGFDDGRSIGLPGSQAALPIFAEFLTAGIGRDGDGEFEQPSGLQVVAVNEETGLRSGPGCRGEPELFLRGTAPSGSCSYWARDWRKTSERRSYDQRVESIIDKLRRNLRSDGSRRPRSSTRRRGTDR